VRTAPLHPHPVSPQPSALGPRPQATSFTAPAAPAPERSQAQKAGMEPAPVPRPPAGCPQAPHLPPLVVGQYAHGLRVGVAVAINLGVELEVHSLAVGHVPGHLRQAAGTATQHQQQSRAQQRSTNSSRGHSNAVVETEPTGRSQGSGCRTPEQLTMPTGYSELRSCTALQARPRTWSRDHVWRLHSSCCTSASGLAVTGGP
jgi:hypothetical protein